MKAFFGIMAFCLVSCLGYWAYAVTVNPTSNVLGDSDNTANTLVYRDSSGNFTAGTITVTDSTIGTAKLTGEIVRAQVAEDAIDTTKLYLFNGTADSGKVLCFRASGAIGYCSDAPASGQNYCTCK